MMTEAADNFANVFDSKRGRLILLFYHSMNAFGGIQTLIMRIAKSETQNGNRVFIVANTDSVVVGVEDFCIVDIKEILGKVEMFQKEAGIDVMAFAPNSAAVAFQFCRAIARRGGKVRFGVGVYHPRDFFRENERWHLHILNFFLARSIGFQCISFMNDGCRISHEKFFRKSCELSKVVPVPMDKKDRAWKTSSGSGKLKVVSVGRIVPFKAYNFFLPALLKRLSLRGLDAQCDIFGHGTHESELALEIQKHSADNAVRFRGALPFELYDSTIQAYDLFVGMGTAALQAAQLGVPTLLAIDNDLENCYGYIHEVPFGNVGEDSPHLKRFQLEEAILAHSQKGPEEVLRISEACSNAASAYVSESYVARCLQGCEFSTGIRSFYGEMFVKIYRLLGERNRLTCALASSMRLLRKGVKT